MTDLVLELRRDITGVRNEVILEVRRNIAPPTWDAVVEFRRNVSPRTTKGGPRPRSRRAYLGVNP